MTTPVWQVDLYVVGPVSLHSRHRTIQQKGFRSSNPFYSDIDIQPVPFGLRATVTARASDEELAYKAAAFFFGKMLDVLTLKINRPLYLNLIDKDNIRGERNVVRRVIELREIEQAFMEAQELATMRPTYLRALGWYRKALSGDDPFDKFLAFWNSIETIAGKYYQYIPAIDKGRAKNGSKSQLWECFKALWGNLGEWPIISGQDKWIDENYDVRIGIAHGVQPVDIHTVAEVIKRLKPIEQVAYNFLRDWRERFLYLNRNPEPMVFDVVAEGASVQ